MATQVIRIQTDVNLGRREQLEPGRFTNFIETAKELLGVYFNTNHAWTEYSPKLSAREKVEIDSYLNGVGPA